MFVTHEPHASQYGTLLCGPGQRAWTAVELISARRPSYLVDVLVMDAEDGGVLVGRTLLLADFDSLEAIVVDSANAHLVQLKTVNLLFEKEEPGTSWNMAELRAVWEWDNQRHGGQPTLVFETKDRQLVPEFARTETPRSTDGMKLVFSLP